MQSTDIQPFRCDETTGRATSNRINSGVVANVFPHAKVKHRTEGRELNEKIAWRLMNIDNLPLLDPEHWIDSGSATSDEYIVKCLCDASHTKDDLQAYMATQDLVGECKLKTELVGGETEIVVTVKHANLLPSGIHEILRDGMTLRISDMTSAIIEDGTEEDVVASGTLITDGLDVTIPLSSAVVGAFAAGSRVSGLLAVGADIEASATITKTSAAGTIDESKIKLDNIGGVDDTFTLTMTSATSFECVGSHEGILATGSIDVDYAPINPAAGRQYFTLATGFFTGTWAIGDEVEIVMKQATLYVAEKQIIVANASAFQAAETAIVIAGEVAQ